MFLGEEFMVAIVTIFPDFAVSGHTCSYDWFGMRPENLCPLPEKKSDYFLSQEVQGTVC